MGYAIPKGPIRPALRYGTVRLVCDLSFEREREGRETPEARLGGLLPFFVTASESSNCPPRVGNRQAGPGEPGQLQLPGCQASLVTRGTHSNYTLDTVETISPNLLNK